MNPNQVRHCYRLLVDCYPLEFRRRHGDDMIRHLDADWERARATGSAEKWRFWTHLLFDFAKSWPSEFVAAVPRRAWIAMAILPFFDAFGLYFLHWRLQVIACAVAWFGSLMAAWVAYYLRPAKALGLVFLYALMVFFAVRLALDWLDLRSSGVHAGFVLKAILFPILALQGLGFALNLGLQLKSPGFKANIWWGTLFFVAPLLAGVSLALAGVGWNFVIWGSTWGVVICQPLAMVFRLVRLGVPNRRSRPA